MLTCKMWSSLLPLLGLASAITLPSGYDTIWETQSTDSSASMPMGGGDLGLNVWVENGHLLFYMQQSGAFDENNSLLKLGRMNITMTPNLLGPNDYFRQHLNINDGYIQIVGVSGLTINIWVDMFTSNIHLNATSSPAVSYTLSFETWRQTGYQMYSPEQQQTSWGVNTVQQIPEPYQYPDTIKYTSGGLLSYHHNSDTPLFNAQSKQQGLQDPGSYFNPMRNNTFGLFVYSPQLKQSGFENGTYISTPYVGYTQKTSSTTSFNMVIGTNQTQTQNVAGWVNSLISTTKASIANTQTNTINWWNSYWDRSWIIINPDADSSDSGFQVGKNYQYFRYMMACNAKGTYPMRFNGGLFTFDPNLVSSGGPYTPDFRRWSGGTFTAQNQRLLYWPLLKTGDFDIMTQAFNFYQNISPNSRKLGQLYFGLDVGVTSEQIDNTGLPNIYEYDANAYGSNPQQRTALYPPGIDFNNYLSWLQDTANEFADMVVMSNSFYGEDVSKWISFVEYQLAWFDEFYSRRNQLTSDGKLILYPTSGAETYKLATNPASTVSGLYRTITDMLASNIQFVKGNTTYYEEYRNRVPATPIEQCPGYSDLTCIAPAQNYSFTQNDECVAMYPVFPWGEYGLGQPTNLSYALHEYFNDTESASFHGVDGWRQDQIWWARMGLTDLATANTIYRLEDSTTYRFSAFKGPNYDWSPDINHYGSAALGLQEMLMQTFALNNTQIRLLGAWPSDWSGSFKLTAPAQTVVSGTINNGNSISGLSITPESRMADVVYGYDQSQNPYQYSQYYNAATS